MALRRCLDCRAICATTRCPRCTSTKERQRGSATQRGYDSAWQRVVKAVLLRDRGVCHICGLPGATTGDHVVPLSRGGARLDLANVKAAHSACNSSKGARLTIHFTA